MNLKINTQQLAVLRDGLTHDEFRCDGSTANALTARGLIQNCGFFYGKRHYKLTPAGRERAKFKADSLAKTTFEGPRDASLMEDLP